METLENLTKTLTKVHERKWVAFAEDYSRIVGFNESLVALKKDVGEEDVVYMKIPPSDVYLTF